MVREEEGRTRDTRMRVNRREPKDQDEQREFHEILEQFKRGIDENLDSEDYQSHYDLGVAFKEMGLLDEAIARVSEGAPGARRAAADLRGARDGVLREGPVSPRARSVLRRAIEGLDGGDEAKIGLLYWLGRALGGAGQGGRRDRELRASHGGRHPVHGSGPADAAAGARGGGDEIPKPRRSRWPSSSSRSAPRLDQVQQELRRHRRGGLRADRRGQRAPVPDAGQDVPAHARCCWPRRPSAAGIRGRPRWQRWWS